MNESLTKQSPKERSKDYQNEIKKTKKQAYQKWTEELDNKLTEMFCFGIPINEIAECTDRTVGAIRSRIKKLELRDKYMT